jgi:hypothetical protein
MDTAHNVAGVAAKQLRLSIARLRAAVRAPDPREALATIVEIEDIAATLEDYSTGDPK